MAEDMTEYTVIIRMCADNVTDIMSVLSECISGIGTDKARITSVSVRKDDE